MSWRLALVLAALGALACDPLASVELKVSSSPSALIFGSECSASEANAAVGVLVDARVNFGDGPQDLQTLLCSGVRVAPDVVLTAAHCVDLEAQGATFVESATWSVSTATDLRAVYEQTAPLPAARVEVLEVHVPEAFDPASFLEASGLSSEADVAVLVLAGDIAGPDVIVDAPDEVTLTAPTPVALVGYGSTDPGGAVSGAVGLLRCVDSFVSEVTDDEVKVGLGSTSGRRCVVDSGGPTFADTSEGRRLVALGSRAWDAETACSGGHVETRLDAYWTWIDDVMRDACERGARVSCTIPGLVRPLRDDAGLSLDAGAEDAAGNDDELDAGDDPDAADAPEDAGSSDAGAPDDASAPVADAGLPADGGQALDGGAPSAPPGCTCGATGTGGRGLPALFLPLLALVPLARRAATAKQAEQREQRHA